MKSPFLGLVPAFRSPTSGSFAAKAARIAAGVLVGTLAGVGLATGVVVARAHFQNHYIESSREVLGWPTAPIPVGTVAGAVVGARGGSALATAGAGLVAGAAVGAAAGAAIAASSTDDPEDRWAGGVIGGALGVVVGPLLAWLIAVRRHRAMVALLAAGLLGAAGCGGEPTDPTWLEPARPIPDSAAPVEDVVFLVGDPGKARYRHYPLFPRVAGEVEEWAQRIGRDSAVTVVVLGDVIYPDGMHAPGTDAYPGDSARVSDQVAMVGAPGALDRSARMYFVAGNHDWGLREDRPGARRLRNLGAFLDRLRRRSGGENVDLQPPAGTGEPGVVDIGDHLRLILLDTAWWIFDAEPGGKDAMVEAVARALSGAGGREVVVVAHHPWESAGPHGGMVPLWRTLGVQYLLFRSGALLQDLSSRPYVELKRALGRVFLEHGRPLVFAGGHEHSLQLLRHDDATAPRFSVVSGSASKLTGVRTIPGTMYAESAPGYVRVLIRENGAVDVSIVATSPDHLVCPEEGADGAALDWETCMREGVAGFRPVFEARLSGPSPPSGGAP